MPGPQSARQSCFNDCEQASRKYANIHSINYLLSDIVSAGTMPDMVIQKCHQEAPDQMTVPWVNGTTACVKCQWENSNVKTRTIRGQVLSPFSHLSWLSFNLIHSCHTWLITNSIIHLVNSCKPNCLNFLKAQLNLSPWGNPFWWHWVLSSLCLP